ncbi:MAG: ABC transporter substrate-binding protein [Flavobacteriales bacterium]|nr:ABC transporter substrate-binding protein [Flavobacteriales bacterium]
MRSLTDQMGRVVLVPERPQRIISLVPSQTELLYDLGLGERVVGITKFCVHPETWFNSKHRVGGTKKVDMEKVRALKPDLIIGNKEENERKDIQALEQEFPVWMSDVRDLNGALDMISAMGEITGTKEKANEIRNGITQAFGELKPMEEPSTVAYFIWREPYMVAGHATFVNDMLLRLGLINVFDEGDARYPEITSKELEDASPEVILLSSEPYPFKQKHIEEFKEICPDARVELVDGEFFSWYGSRLLKAPAYFASLDLK